MTIGTKHGFLLREDGRCAAELLGQTSTNTKLFLYADRRSRKRTIRISRKKSIWEGLVEFIRSKRNARVILITIIAYLIN